jgi:cell division protein FtsB
MKTAILAVLFLGSYALAGDDPNRTITQLRRENAQLKNQVEQLQAENAKLRQIQQSINDSNRPKQDTTLLLKQKLLLKQQKQSKLVTLKQELLNIPPTIKQSQPDRVINTVNKSSGPGYNYVDKQQTYQPMPDITVPNPAYTEQNRKIAFLENSITQIEREISQLNDKRIRNGQEPIN